MADTTTTIHPRKGDQIDFSTAFDYGESRNTSSLTFRFGADDVIVFLDTWDMETIADQLQIAADSIYRYLGRGVPA